jgi:hypothetical protein
MRLLYLRQQVICRHPHLYICVFVCQYGNLKKTKRIKRRIFSMLRNTRSKLMNILPHLVMIVFKFLVSQAANNLKKYACLDSLVLYL